MDVVFGTTRQVCDVKLKVGSIIWAETKLYAYPKTSNRGGSLEELRRPGGLLQRRGAASACHSQLCFNSGLDTI